MNAEQIAPPECEDLRGAYAQLKDRLAKTEQKIETHGQQIAAIEEKMRASERRRALWGKP